MYNDTMGTTAMMLAVKVSEIEADHQNRAIARKEAKVVLGTIKPITLNDSELIFGMVEKVLICGLGSNMIKS